MTKSKAVIGLLLAAVAAGVLAVASSADGGRSSSQSGELHVTKDCSAYFGKAGEFCTIKGSNLRQIRVDSKVFYLKPAGATGVDSDLVLYAGPGNVAFGHVTLSFASLSGSVVFTEGTGKFRGFRARVLVTFDDESKLWRWDGRYRYERGDD